MLAFRNSIRTLHVALLRLLLCNLGGIGNESIMLWFAVGWELDDGTGGECLLLGVVVMQLLAVVVILARVWDAYFLRCGGWHWLNESIMLWFGLSQLVKFLVNGCQLVLCEDLRVLVAILCVVVQMVLYGVAVFFDSLHNLIDICIVAQSWEDL